MSWTGYFEYGGTEIVNVTRTETYARNLGVYAVRPVFNNTALPLMLGDTYASPLQDNAPWLDPDDSDTYGFIGVYPVDIQGVEDSTWTAPVTESTRDGGVVGRGRFAARSVTFNVALVGVDEGACAAGLRWLKQVLTGPPCLGPQVVCGGDDLCYLDSAPMLDPNATGDPTTCLSLNSLRNVTATVAPTVTAKSPLSSGGEVWLVNFTMVAGNPFEFGPEVPIVAGFMDPLINVPYVGGVVPADGSFDADGFVQTEVACPSATYQPVVDPLCPAIIAPPAVPNVALGCFTFPINYLRRQFVVPKQDIPLWTDVVPLLTIHARHGEVRNLRVRFYADVFDTGDPNQDPCNYCGDMVFTYIPANSSMVFDGSDRQVYVENVANGRRRAESLVFTTSGDPFDWPILSCGFGYIVTVDLPQDVASTPPTIDLSLYPRSA